MMTKRKGGNPGPRPTTMGTGAKPSRQPATTAICLQPDTQPTGPGFSARDSVWSPPAVRRKRAKRPSRLCSLLTWVASSTPSLMGLPLIRDGAFPGRPPVPWGLPASGLVLPWGHHPRGAAHFQIDPQDLWGRPAHVITRGGPTRAG